MARSSDRRRIEIELEARHSDLLSARAELADAQREAQALKARVEELEAADGARTQVQGLEGTLAERDPQALDADTQQLAIRVAELEARLTRASDEGEAGSADAAEQLRELTERALILEAQLDAARIREEELVGHAVRADALLADVGVRLAQFGGAADRVADLERELAEAVSREEGHRSEVEVLEHQTEGLKEQLAVTQLERDGARSELVRLMEVEQELTARVTQFEAEIQQAAEDAQQALDSIHEAEQARERAESRAAELEAHLEAASGKLREVEEAQGPLQARLEELQSAHDLAEQRSAEHQQALESLRNAGNEAGSRVAELEAQLEAASGQVRESEEAQVPLRARVEELQAAHGGAEQQIAEALDRAQQAEQRAGEAADALASAEAEVREAQGRASQFETELATATAQMRDMERTHNLEARVGELQERARTGEVHEGLTPVEARLVEVEKALLDAQEQAQEAENKEREAQEQIQAAATDLAASETNLQQLQEVYETVRVQAEDLRLRQQVLEADLASATTAPANAAGAGAPDGAEPSTAEPSEATVLLQSEVERATARIQELERQLEEAASRPQADGVSDRSRVDTEPPGELAAVVAELEDRLEATEARARRAYGAAEAAEAALRFAKESGEIVSSDPQLESEVERLRNQIPELMKRVEQAEEARKRAEADAAALRGSADHGAGDSRPEGGAPTSTVTDDDVSPGVAAWR
jgi:chromosome segregation ATPase